MRGNPTADRSDGCSRLADAERRPPRHLDGRGPPDATTVVAVPASGDRRRGTHDDRRWLPADDRRGAAAGGDRRGPSAGGYQRDDRRGAPAGGGQRDDRRGTGASSGGGYPRGDADRGQRGGTAGQRSGASAGSQAFAARKKTSSKPQKKVVAPTILNNAKPARHQHAEVTEAPRSCRRARACACRRCSPRPASLRVAPPRN